MTSYEGQQKSRKSLKNTFINRYFPLHGTMSRGSDTPMANGLANFFCEAIEQSRGLQVTFEEHFCEWRRDLIDVKASTELCYGKSLEGSDKGRVLCSALLVHAFLLFSRFSNRFSRPRWGSLGPVEAV